MTTESAEERVARNYVKTSTAADLLEIDAVTCQRLFSRGKLRGFVVDGIRLISMDSLKKFMESRRTALATAHATQGTEN